MSEIIVTPNAIEVDGLPEIDMMFGTVMTTPVETVPAPAKKARASKPRTRKPRAAKKAVAVVTTEPAFSFGSYSGATSEPEELGVIDQIRVASKSPLATLVGIILGGFVPIATYSVKHFDTMLNEYVMWTLVIGGLIYSALTVHTWASNAFQSGLKALGFVVLIEGVMTLSNLPGLSYAALTLLVVISGVATGANLSLKGQK